MDAQENAVGANAKDEVTTTNKNVEEIYIKEEPLEDNSQDFEVFENFLQSVKKEECITDNDSQIDKESDNPVTINNDNGIYKDTNSNVTIISLYNLCEDKFALLRKLQEWNLIPRSLQCRKCGGSLTLCEDSSRIDGWRWKCRNKTAQNKQKRKTCGNAILAFVNLWVGNATLLLIQEQLELNYVTCVDWASFCREVLLTHFVNNKTKLGGPGHVVEIHESMFGKRKYHRGRRVDGQWIFGCYERGTGRVFMVPVDDRGADTLIPVIEEWIEPGTTIVSDFWRAHDCLNSRGYLHLTVNHSVNFRDPDTDANTISIESSWRAAKAIMTPSGRKKAHIPGNLARYIFYKKCLELKLNRTEEFFRLAGATYDATLPVPKEEEENDMDVEDLDL